MWKKIAIANTIDAALVKTINIWDFSSNNDEGNKQWIVISYSIKEYSLRIKLICLINWNSKFLILKLDWKKNERNYKFRVLKLSWKINKIM